MPIFTGFSNLSALLPFDQTVLYPLSNTTLDPTSQTWRANNPNYVWIPNVGINVPQPLTDVSYMFAGNATFNDPDISTWITNTFVNLTGMFSGCFNFNQPLNNWITTSATTMNEMFKESAFNQNINSWNVSKVTNMSEMFYLNRVFNQALSSWDTSSVTNMFGMFKQSSFNQNINSWNVSKVTNMSEMFYLNRVFNQALSNWNTSSVTNFSSMFRSCTDFNQNIGSWNVSKAQNMSYMFYGNTSFNCGQSGGIAHDLMQRLGREGWQTRNVVDMTSMFFQASAFNGNISGWCVLGITSAPSNFAFGTGSFWTTARQPPWGFCPILYELYQSAVDPTHPFWRANNPVYQFIPYKGILMKTPMTNASYMFFGRSFNDNSIADWDTSTFTTTAYMFSNSSFVGPLGNWNVSNVTDMTYMFNATAFDQPIGNWNVSNVTSMKYMFAATPFNQNISSWNVSRVTVFWGMFNSATSFNCSMPSGAQHTLMQRTATSGWRTNAAFDMYQMFFNARSFAGNINQWCTSASGYGPNPPGDFSYGTQMPNNFLPTWGTCPIP